ncbi:divalent-cation tolerance protein CutA [Glaciimonas sp. PAMC28666]|uniref:divalent-cation tolerance protein CutA n=1 Tax=Glaciimonas sp. PAMC28666 TaxID=2807626 RepID=UPI001F03D620|nr:divalent-cation tolerance protein CutA [Glaciimonas sp. PAMC28666]
MTTMPNLADADALAQQLVERKLAACVNILPGVRSVYLWQGVLERSDEVAMMIKTTTERYSELEEFIRSVHPYALPEIIAIPLAGGLPAYLEWIGAATQRN